MDALVLRLLCVRSKPQPRLLPRAACTWEGTEGHEPGVWGRQPLEAQWRLGRTWEQRVQPCLPEAQRPWGGPWGRPTAQVSPLETGIPSLET